MPTNLTSIPSTCIRQFRQAIHWQAARASWLVLTVLFFASGAQAFEPSSNYEPRQIEGWHILINKKLLADAPLSTNVLKLLDHQLYQITRVVPEPALSRLRDVIIWVELTDPPFACSCYHPSGKWLREHDVNPEKATAVEISNATNFLSWTHEQPWMILHELAHSYHHRVLGYENLDIKAAYKQAVDSKSYESVQYFDGRMLRHYALTNEQEYFAECSEAFFGVNDFYPFVRSELQKHDPGMFLLLQKVWGMPGAGKVAPTSTPRPAGPE